MAPLDGRGASSDGGRTRHEDAKTRLKKRARRTRRRFVDIFFNLRVYSRLRKRQHILCLGDSNVLLVKGMGLPGNWLYARGLGGATASGIPNPNNGAESFVELGRRLELARPWQDVLFMLGGIDTSFTIWFSARERGTTAEEEMTRALDAYEGFLRRAVAIGFRRLFVLSAPLSTIPDSRTDFGSSMGRRGEIGASQADRVRMALAFNAELERRCQALGAIFVDVTSEQLDPETGLVAERFVRSNLDHHLDETAFQDLFQRKLAAIL